MGGGARWTGPETAFEFDITLGRADEQNAGPASEHYIGSTKGLSFWPAGNCLILCPSLGQPNANWLNWIRAHEQTLGFNVLK